MFCAGVSFAAGPIVHQIPLPSGMAWCDDSMINGLFTQINTFRAQNGAPALTLAALGMLDAELRATQFASYMVTNPPGSPGFNPHQGYDTTAASIGYNLVSENLAYISNDPVEIVFAIWQDPLHIAAMLSPYANVSGVSCVSYQGTYWTTRAGTTRTAAALLRRQAPRPRSIAKSGRS